MTAAMMREGTATKNTQQISETLETMAATVGVGAGMSSAVATVTGSSLTENFDATFALAPRSCCTPTFPQEEFDRYKTRTRDRPDRSSGRNPGFLANEMFARVVYGAHPAVARLGDRADVLDKTTRDALVAFHRAHYVPDHAVLAIAGDISLARSAQARRRQARRRGRRPARRIRSVADPPALGPAQGLLHRAAELGADEPVGRHAGHLADEPRLRRRDGDERGHRRRSDGPAVHGPARGEGLHLRRVQQHLRAAVPRQRGRRRWTCARKSPSRRSAT